MFEEQNENQEISEEQRIRDEVFAEVFNGEVPETAAESTRDFLDPASSRDNSVEQESEKDPLAGIPSALRSQIDEISNRLNSLGTIEERLKQTERRVGSIQNEFHAAKQVANEKQKHAPTEEEMAAAAKDKAEWDDLKDEYPEWAEAIEKKLAATSAEFSKDLPVLRDSIKDIREKQGSFVSTEVLEGRLLSMIYPDWKNVVNTQEYQEWLKAQSADVQARHYKGATADDAVFVLDKFHAFSTNGKTQQDITAARKKRLKQAETTTTRQREKPQKSEAEMTEDEIREIEFGKIWG